MSYTEIYKISESKKTSMIGEIKNSWRGAMAVWSSLEKVYLPMLPRPFWLPIDQYLKDGYWRTHAMGSKENPMQEIWNLTDDVRLSATEKISLLSTFDKVYVLRSDLTQLVNAFTEFPYESSLKEQAAIIETVSNDPDCWAVCWNQTSVNADIPGDEIELDSWWEFV